MLLCVQFEFELSVARMVLGPDADVLGGLLANSSGWLGASDETHCGKMATLKVRCCCRGVMQLCSVLPNKGGSTVLGTSHEEGCIALTLGLCSVHQPLWHMVLCTGFSVSGKERRYVCAKVSCFKDKVCPSALLLWRSL